jgi:hypothetical protein
METEGLFPRVHEYVSRRLSLAKLIQSCSSILFPENPF